MKEIRLLLENFWIDKNKNREDYFLARKKENELRKFFAEKPGWKIISNEKIIKVEKIPAKAESFMGIERFQEKLDYCILCGLLIFLEEKEDGEQFLLHEIIDNIEFLLKDYIEIDWLKFTHRKSLIRAFEYAEEMRLLSKTEGDIKNFTDNRDTEVLYEKTGLSRYFSVNFNRDIFSFGSYKDFEIKDENFNKGENRTSRVYRKLLTTPAVYWENFDDSDKIYIKNQKPALELNIERQIEGKLHIHKNGAFLIFDNKKVIGHVHPGKTVISEIVLLVCGELRKKVREKKFEKELNDFLYIYERELKDIIKECRKNYSINWSKEFRELNEEKLFVNILEYMESWLFAERKNEKILIYPGIAKIVGMYKDKNKISGGEDE